MASLGLSVGSGTIAPKIESFTFPVMGAGTITAQVPLFCQGLSQILGFERIVNGGVLGNPYVATLGAVVAGGVGGAIGSNITVNSTSAGDTSTYRVYYTNPVYRNLLP
jgi:hypothetical protein